MNAKKIIQYLDLKPLPIEGGFFREIYRSDKNIAPLNRCFATHIYYLVTPEDFSPLHKVASDELFHFYLGDSVEQIQISPDGELRKYRLGVNLLDQEYPMAAVPANHWQGLRLVEGGAWALMGCTVAPGFEYEDLQMGIRENLIKRFPVHAESISHFCK